LQRHDVFAGGLAKADHAWFDVQIAAAERAAAE